MLPWSEMLRAALAAGILPRAFWALSLREWRWIASGADATGRSELAAMMARFPDKEERGL